ncbi:hypothetical protein JCM18750_04060 [Halostagnicola bangensis]
MAGEYRLLVSTSESERVGIGIDPHNAVGIAETSTDREHPGSGSQIDDGFVG